VYFDFLRLLVLAGGIIQLFFFLNAHSISSDFFLRIFQNFVWMHCALLCAGPAQEGLSAQGHHLADDIMPMLDEDAGVCLGLLYMYIYMYTGRGTYRCNAGHL
jgi:hypothetical protein